MTEREKVIKGLECCQLDVNKCLECPYFDKQTDSSVCGITLHHDAITLLKAQEPVKPVVDIDEWKCGNCGHKLEHQELLGDNVLFHEQYDFCPCCGRAVKWE